MHAGIALTDEDRLPWLRKLHEQLEKYSSLNRSCIITCSALKKAYRQILLTGTSDPDIKGKLPTEDFYLIINPIFRFTCKRKSSLSFIPLSLTIYM